MEITKLKLKPINNGKCILEDDYIYSINGFLITVPKGFITDGASIPKSLQWIYDPFGKYIKGAVIHDYFILNITIQELIALLQIKYLILL